jgi:MoxR-like ATPase
MTENILVCKQCGAEVKDYLGNHLLEEHQLTVPNYLEKYPGALVVSKRLWAQFQTNNKGKRREHPCPPEKLVLSLSGVEFPVNSDVPESACLPMPDHYQLPRYGKLGEDVAHTLISLRFQRSLYVWGLPGSGKDALFHAWSAMTRTPALIRQVKPGTDIEAWFYSRGFTEKGTFWEEGAVLKALRDGYVTSTGRRLPYLILITDFDRADREQAEHLRLITDSIQGRIDGPAGTTFTVLPGTTIVATANTSGGGDERGRMISANPLDASLLDRFKRKFKFHWMDWRDESVIIQAKFPVLLQRAPSILPTMKDVTKKLREAILNGDLHAEFSHRALCDVLEHAQDIMISSKKLNKHLLTFAVRTWVDGLPDEENRLAAKQILDPRLGVLSEGDTSHIGVESLASMVGDKNAN